MRLVQGISESGCIFMKLLMSEGWIGDLSWELIGRDKQGNEIAFIVCSEVSNLLVKTVIEEKACSGRTKLSGSFAEKILQTVDSGLIDEGTFLSLTGLSADVLESIKKGESVEVDSLIAANCSYVINRTGASA